MIEEMAAAFTSLCYGAQVAILVDMTVIVETKSATGGVPPEVKRQAAIKPGAAHRRLKRKGLIAKIAGATISTQRPGPPGCGALHEDLRPGACSGTERAPACRKS